LNQLTARRLYEYRQQHGPFRNRDQFKEVPGFGDATFVQAAGFLRITNGDNPLDATWIHPESYEAAQRVIEELGCSVSDLAASVASSQESGDTDQPEQEQKPKPSAEQEQPPQDPETSSAADQQDHSESPEAPLDKQAVATEVPAESTQAAAATDKPDELTEAAIVSDEPDEPTEATVGVEESDKPAEAAARESRLVQGC
jgi:uncharacterized protein